MAYDPELAERLRHLVNGADVLEKRMFGGLAFLVHGNVSVAASSDGGLLVRVEPAATEALLAEPGAEPFEMGGRGPMKGWLHVSPDVLHDDQVLGAWATRGVDYARSLPKK